MLMSVGWAVGGSAFVLEICTNAKGRSRALSLLAILLFLDTALVVIASLNTKYNCSYAGTGLNPNM